MKKQLFSAVALGILTAGAANAQNDECTGAIALTLGATAFDTLSATLSAPAWPCAASGGPDIWYTYTAASTNDIRIETCGSTYDTALQAFSGTCASLTSIVCNDDACGLQSAIVIGGVTVGTVYTFRVGGFNGNSGSGTVTISEVAPPPPPPPGCFQTLFASNNQGSVGGAVYFDVTAASATSIDTLLTNFAAVAGTAVGLEVYTTPGTYAGNEANAAAWTLAAMDNGTATAVGVDIATVVPLAAPLNLPVGTTGIALVAVGSGHRYTNGSGANQSYTDGNLTLSLGSATNLPFAGTAFQPRVWNGAFCASGPSSQGTPFCAANANSTGVAGAISAFGSAAAADNDITLTASNLPVGQFGIFVTSATTIPGNPVGAGVLCLGGAVGRYNAPGQILQANASGEFSLALNLTLTPLPSSVTSVMAGDTRSWQAWHRDFAGMSLTSNFTNGVTIAFN